MSSITIKKITMFTLLAATVMVAGMFAFVPVEQAATVHLSGSVTANEVGSVDTGLQVTAQGVLTDEDDSVVSIGELLGVTSDDVNTVVNVLTLIHSTTDTGANGDATAISLQGEDAGGNIEEIGLLEVEIFDAGGTGDAEFNISLIQNNVVTEVLTLSSLGVLITAQGITATTGAITLAATENLSLDAGGDTFIEEPAADDMDFNVGGIVPLALFEVGDQAHPIWDTTAGITANVGQTQAAGEAVASRINEISAIAVDNDSVTLPAAVAGTIITIINSDTAQDLGIFPAVGDNIDGNGIDTVDIIQENTNITYVAIDATNWEVV